MSSDNEYLNPSEKNIATEWKNLAQTRQIEKTYPHAINLPSALYVLANQWIKENIAKEDAFYWYSDFETDIYRFKNRDDALLFKLHCHR